MEVNEMIVSKDFGRLIKFFIRRKKLNIPDIEDFESEVALRMMTFPPLDNSLKPSTIILKTAYWTYLDRVKKSVRKRKIAEVPLDNMDFEAKIPSYETKDELENAVSKMTDRQQEVFHLLEEGYTISEIAQLHNCSPQNVYALRDAGIKSVREKCT
jgi:RNA polymerase sigma factor (sigma-70 family)